MATSKRELVENYITENKITKTEFCKRCGIGNSTLNKFFNNELKKMLPLFRISRLLKIKSSGTYDEKQS